MTEQYDKIRDRLLNRAAISLPILFLALHIVWRVLDHTPPRGDQTFYINGAVHIQKTWNLSWLQWFRELNDVTLTHIRPPGSSLLLVPWLTAFQNDLQLAQLGAVLWHALTFLILYRLGKRFFDSTTGLLAGVFFMCLPAIYDTAIDPEFYFMTLLPLALLCCSHLWDENRRRGLWWLAMGLVTALGLLCKWVFAIYLLGPMLFLGFDLMGRIRRTDPSLRMRRFGFESLLMILPVLLATAWYWRNWTPLSQEFRSISETRLFTPFKEGWSWQVFLHYPKGWLIQNKIVPFFMLIPGILYLLIPGKLWRKVSFFHPLEAQERQNAFLLLSSLVGTWVYFCIRIDNIPLKYILALQPILALFGVIWIRKLAPSFLRRCFYSVLFCLALITSLWMHFAPLSWIGNSPLPRTVTYYPNLSFLRYAVPVPRPPHRQAWPHESIVESIARLERENPFQPDKRVAFQSVLVLPDIYYFDWRNCRTLFNLKGLDIDAAAIPDRTGLLRIAFSRYIVTSRGQCTRFGLENRDEMIRNALALNRLIDRAPPWFWNNFRMVDRFAMPYDLPELQLFRRIKPMDEAEAIGWCEFWISHHKGEAAAWEQVIKIWANQRNPARMARAAKIHSFLANPGMDKNPAMAELQSDPNLLPYELLELDGAMLKRCAESKSLCSWRANWELGKIELKRNQFDAASEYLLKAWRREREKPEILRTLEESAKQKQDTAGVDLFKQLIGIAQGLLANNRRPILYQNAANLLLSAEWNTDALWYAFQGFVAGLNRYPNTKPLHTALYRTGRSLSDYETIPLPFPSWSDRPKSTTLALKSGQSLVFPFLNLDGGVYRLHWKQRVSSPSLILAFFLDETPLGIKTWTADSIGGEFIFPSPLWGDRLRIDCLAGETEWNEVELQRIEADVPFTDWDGSLNVQGKNYHSEQVNPAGGFSFKTDSDWVRLNFNIHSDPRAWDSIRIASTGLQTQSATFTLIVRGDGKTDEEFVFSHPMRSEAGREYSVIPLPEESRRYPFLLGIRMHLENLPEAGQKEILKIVLHRNH